MAKIGSKTMQKRLKQTTCAYCGVGCGIDVSVAVQDDEVKLTELKGSPDHPANQGRLCVKGTHLLDTLGLKSRLLHPLIKGQRSSWTQATTHVASELKRIIEQYGSDAVAFYVSGQLLTEDYYVANKLMKGYIGSANIDTNSRLCMSSAVAGYKRAFGEDVVPCDYQDLEHTDYLVMIGSNAAWTHPVLYQRMERAKQLNPAMRVVVIDPRRTETCVLADQFLPIRAGSDAGLYNGLLAYAAAHGHLDETFIAQHTEGFSAALNACQEWNIARVADYCKISEAQILGFYRGFCAAKKALTFFSMGINQSSTGVDKCNAIINAHLATGQLLKPGAGPFSITGQPNAMGGREVGGLANQLAAHLDIENPQHREWVQTFWQSPRIASQAGYKAVDLFSAMQQGKIKAVWIMATNPVVSLPNRKAIEAALAQCELVIVSDCVAQNDTLEYADVALPAAGWGEKDGTVTNSERLISRQRGLQPLAGEAKPDWQIICEVAMQMGYEGFNYPSNAAIFDEWTRLTSYQNQGQRQLNLGGLSGLSQEEYLRLEPTQWPVESRQERRGQVFKNYRFSTVTGKACFIPILPCLPQQKNCSEYPLIMNSGRIRDQWHTMTRSGLSQALNTHIERPQITVHPADAEQYQLVDGELVRATSSYGSVIANAQVSDQVKQGECFMPIHWSQQVASDASVAALYSSIVDPLSGQPESKFVPIQLKPVHFQQFAVLRTRQTVAVTADYWLRIGGPESTHLELAFAEPIADPLSWCQQLSGIQGEWISFFDGTQMNVQCVLDGHMLLVAVFADAQPRGSKEWLDYVFTQQCLTDVDKQAVLYDQPAEEFLQGPLVCSCFKVREQPIIDAIRGGCDSVQALGEQLQCGTNCGSCKSELSQLVKRHQDASGEYVQAEVIPVVQLETL
ncbi:nitrate reductase [Alteromonas flava]|uniref:nitrate reductase n=1 Tax=Alteromonas flava TaxID=2048003 RepID=UPI000C28E1A6|nr:nitrate reductase [Alteromonas flava]